MNLIPIVVAFVITSVIGEDSKWTDQFGIGNISYLQERRSSGDAFNPDSVTFHMHSKNNPIEYRQLYKTESSIEEANVDSWKCLVVTVHGWTKDKNDPLNNEHSAWIQRYGCVAIAVQWSTALAPYVNAVRSLPYVAKEIAGFVDLVIEQTGLPLDQIYFIGHSLGAHAVGFSARAMKMGKPGYICGLDPASVLFTFTSPQRRLNVNDAVYVECIMTNAGFEGIIKPICQANFVVNGGTIQPGCTDISCSHNFAIHIHREAVERGGFLSKKCSSYIDAFWNNCNDSDIRMGDLANYRKRVKGIFYTPTNDAAPWGL